MHYACQSSEGPLCDDNRWHNVGQHALTPRIPHGFRPPIGSASALPQEPGRLALSPLLLTISWLCFQQQLTGYHHLFPYGTFIRAVEYGNSNDVSQVGLKRIEGAILPLPNHGPPANECGQGGGIWPIRNFSMKRHESLSKLFFSGDYHICIYNNALIYYEYCC